MNAITHDELQGTEEWLALKEGYFSASEAGAMMGVDPKMSRDKLLAIKAGHETNEVDSYTENVVFPNGHKFEALAKPMAEEVIGGELYPVVMSRGDLLASMDGLDMMDVDAWEHKQPNQALMAAVRAGAIPHSHIWQPVQQCYVSGARRVLFMVSDGTAENCAWCWYERSEEDIAQLLAGWEQFRKDLAEFKPRQLRVVPKAEKLDAMPALSIRLSGQVVESNLEAFKGYALDTIESINTDLQSDQDFATAEAAVKWCAESESKIKDAKAAAMSQTASIDELFRTMDEISESLRQKRLSLDKLVKAEKESRKREMVEAAISALRQDCEKVSAEFERVQVPLNVPDFNGAIKGLRTMESQQSAINNALAMARISLNANRIIVRDNLARIQEADAPALFPDLQALVEMDPDTLGSVIETRVAAEIARREESRAREAAQQAARAEREKQANKPTAVSEIAARAIRGIDTRAVTDQEILADVYSSVGALPEAPQAVEKVVVATLVYKDLKSGAKIIQLTGPDGELIELNLAGDGKTKTINIEA